MQKEFFSEKLINWYKYHYRRLPWRNIKDAYKIWLSEIILQQTRVSQGLPYYEKFIENFPTVFDLAKASEEQVLRLWQGLGYYSRARNLHETAKIIVSDFNGKFPEKYADLLKLKGIGSYTAAAIASFAFGEKVAVLDGNVFRVLARIFGLETDIASSQAKKVFGKLANELIDEAKPDIFNQALMEFGALQCQPQSPDCLLCPFNETCVACLTGRQTELPIKSKKTAVKKRYFHYLVFRFAGKTGLKRRTQKDIWQGLYDFFLIEKPDFEDIISLLDENLQKIIGLSEVKENSEIFMHQLTHRQIFAKFLEIHLSEEDFISILENNYGIKFYTIDEIEHLPKPVLITRFLGKAI